MRNVLLRVRPRRRVRARQLPLPLSVEAILTHRILIRLRDTLGTHSEGIHPETRGPLGAWYVPITSERLNVPTFD